MKKAEEWLCHIKQQKLSGKSIKSYCEEHGLVRGSWNYYRKKFLGKPVSSSKFVEAVVVEESPLTKCELVSKSGIRVVFEELPSASWLREVLL